MKIEVTVRELGGGCAPFKATVEHGKLWFDEGFLHVKVDATTTISWPSGALAMIEQKVVEY